MPVDLAVGKRVQWFHDTGLVPLGISCSFQRSEMVLDSHYETIQIVKRMMHESLAKDLGISGVYLFEQSFSL